MHSARCRIARPFYGHFALRLGMRRQAWRGGGWQIAKVSSLMFETERPLPRSTSFNNRLESTQAWAKVNWIASIG